MKHLEHESHKRERSMARVAARAGGGELSVLTVDGNTLAMREAHDLHDLETWDGGTWDWLSCSCLFFLPLSS